MWLKVSGTFQSLRRVVRVLGGGRSEINRIRAQPNFMYYQA